MKKYIPLFLALLVLAAASYNLYLKKSGLSPSQAKTVAEDFIKKNLVEEGTEVQIKNVIPESSLYKLEITVGKQDIVAYLSKDGKTFFPQGMNILEFSKQKEESQKQAQAPAQEVEKKADVPVVELFVMSYCPYGTQIEKGILPVVQTLGEKIKFELKFVDYAMHGEKEVKENLRQYCLQKQDPQKLQTYLGCFLKDDKKADDCLAALKVSTQELESCQSAADQQFQISQKLKDKSTWSGQFPPFDVDKQANTQYGVQGSPTLVINGSEISSGRDAASLLKTICSGFTNQPEECQKELPAETPAPGFGEGSAASASADGDCGTEN